MGAIKGPSFVNLEDKRGMKDKSPTPEGYHYSTPPPSPIINSVFALWANLELTFWFLDLLNPFLSFFLHFSLSLAEIWIYMSILVL